MRRKRLLPIQQLQNILNLVTYWIPMNFGVWFKEIVKKY